jgi:hypothetical protein
MARVMDFINARRDPDVTQEVGIGGFRLFAKISETVKNTSQVPTAYVEDGSPVNDHIILDPLTVTIRGNVADLNVQPRERSQQLARLQAEIGNIAQYAPARTQSQISIANGIINQAADKIREIDAAIDAGEQALDFFSGNEDATKAIQERFLDDMDALFYGKQLVTIDSQYRSYESMVITSFEHTKNNQIDAIEFTITAQQFRQAEIRLIELAAPNPSDGVGGQTDPTKDKGAQEGGEVESSLLSTLGEVIGL